MRQVSRQRMLFCTMVGQASTDVDHFDEFSKYAMAEIGLQKIIMLFCRKTLSR